MVPVEDAAGGAAFVFHNQPEGAPDEDADQVADIKEHRDHKQAGLVDDTLEIQGADGRRHKAPEDKDLIGGLGGGSRIVPEAAGADSLPGGTVAVGEQLPGAQGQPAFHRGQLEEHIRHPDEPEKMQGGKAAEKVGAVQHREAFGPAAPEQGAPRQNQNAPSQAEKVPFPGFGQGRPFVRAFHAATPFSENTAVRPAAKGGGAGPSDGPSTACEENSNTKREGGQAQTRLPVPGCRPR